MKPLHTLLLLLLCTFSASACARPLVELSVIDRDNGRLLAEYHHHGRQYVAGVPGHRYALRLSNRTGERVMVVLSVDGVNVISGETAGTDQGGYVLGPWQSTEIAGWRKSYNDIAQFVFTELDDSYAARTGRPDNVGVIGMAVFRERVRVPVYQPPLYQPGYPSADAGRAESEREQVQSGGHGRYADREDAPASAKTASSSKAGQSRNALGSMGERAMDAASPAPYEPTAQRLGTGHGDREYAPVAETSFERLAASPQQVETLYYDAPERLAARGIIPWRWMAPPQPQGPDAFPAGFVPDPAGW